MNTDNAGRADARREKYSTAMLFDREVLFTHNRIDRSTVPIGMRMYEILPDGSGNPAEIAHSFIGEKYGTIITHCYIPMKHGWRIIGRRDFTVCTERLTLRDFMKIHPPKKKTRQMFGM